LAGMAWGQSGNLTAGSFGFQCGTADSGNCPNYTWPPTQAQPGVFRLWDAQVQWSVLETSTGYNWANLDSWLDAIASHQPRQVIYTFGWTPCYIASGPCVHNNTESASPPSDLGQTGGSKSFTDFVTALVGHCSPSNNCVSSLITYYELWNEANAQAFWTGTQDQLYRMMKPAVSIIKQKIPTAKILTPPLSNSTGFQSWECGWLGEEVANGVISNIYAIHTYLANAIPENKWSLAIQQLAPNNQYAATCNSSGWSPLPWWVTETQYNNGINQGSYPFKCHLDVYSTNDCVGQIVRWQAIINSNGGTNLTWYWWKTAIGNYPLRDTAYYWMMQYMVGGSFSQACTNISGTTWTCPFTEADGKKAFFVWTTTETGTTYYQVPPGYADYRDLSGGTTPVNPAGQQITITVEPIMVEPPPIT
jgi:hypothetical protein